MAVSGERASAPVLHQTLVRVALERGAGATQVAVDRVEHHPEQQL